jgi:hypothetical protein
MLAGLPVHMPPPLPAPKPEAHHWYDFIETGLNDLGQGLYQGALAPLKLGIELAPLNALQDPQDWWRTVQGVGKGLLNDVQHPEEFLKQLVDWKDWTGGHPARAVGQLLPSVLLAIFTDGAGAAADGADAAVGGTAALDAVGGDAAASILKESSQIDPFFAGENIPNNPNNWLGGQSTVRYLSDSELAKFKVSITSDGKLLDANGAPLDTTNASNFTGQSKAIYVVDKDGNVFVSLEQRVGEFHHSSLGQGLPVAGAGEMQVKDGILQYLNRQSGHYKPTAAQLDQVVRYFQAKGVSLGDATVDFGVP